MLDKPIDRRVFLKHVRDAVGILGTRKIGKLEYFAALSAGVTIDVSFNSLIRQANAAEGKIQTYEKPKEWTKIEIDRANFSKEVFPKKLEFAPGKKTVVVSAVWQTAALYDVDGNLVKIGGDELKFLASTGKVEHATELGLYKIQTKKDKDHRSSKYKIKEKVREKVKGVWKEFWKEIGASMPYAMHLGKGFIRENGEMSFKDSDGTAMHARNNVQDDTTTSFMSHGCIGLPYSIAEDFHDGLNVGDQVLVIGEKMPTGVKSINEIVKRLDKENPEYLDYLKKEVSLKPQEIKEKKQCFIYCSATGQNIFDFMSTDPNLNPLRENDKKTVRIPQSGPECSAARKTFYEEATKRCKN